MWGPPVSPIILEVGGSGANRHRIPPFPWDDLDWQRRVEELVGDGLVVPALSVAHDTRAEPHHQHVELHLAQRVVAVLVAFLHHGRRSPRNLATDAPNPRHSPPREPSW